MMTQRTPLMTKMTTETKTHFRHHMETTKLYAKIILFIVYYIASNHRSLGAIVSEKYNDLLEEEKRRPNKLHERQ